MERARPSNRIITQRRLTTLAVVAASVALLLVLLYLLFAGNLLFVLIIVGGMAAVPCVAIMLTRWRWGLYGIIFILIFEGAARNITNQVSILLFKDVLLGLVYIGYFRENGLRFLKVPVLRRLTVVFAIVTTFCTVEILNPNMPSVLVGIVGVKTYVFYIPLLFLVYEALDSERKIEQFIVYTLALGLGSCALGAFQYYGGVAVLRIFQPTDLIGTFGSNGEFISYKIPGSFGGAGNFSYFLQLAFALAMGLFYSKTSRKVTLFSVICIGACCILLVLNSQRVAWLFVVFCFLLGTFTYSTRVWLKVLRFGLAGLIGVAFVVAISSSDNIIGSRFAEFTEGQGVSNYLYVGPQDQINAQLKAIGEGKFFGMGTGMGAPGARYLLDTSFVFVESFIALLLYELGPIGFLLMMGLIIMVIYETWWVYIHSKGHPFHNLLLFCLLWLSYMAVTGLTYAPITIPPTAQFFWILPGIALRLRTLIEPARKPKPIFLGSSNEPNRAGQSQGRAAEPAHAAVERDTQG